MFTFLERFFVLILFFTIFSDDIICDCQTVNAISNYPNIQGTYQKLGYVNGRTSWNSSTGYAVWHSQNYPYWLLGSMDLLGQDMTTLFTFTGLNGCFYNISGDQWQHYNLGVWTYVNVGDVRIQCLSGNFE